MSKGKKNKSFPKTFNRNNYSKQSQPNLQTIKRDPLFWKSLEEYNELDARQRAEGLKALGMIVTDDEILRVLTKSHFVIPGITRLECQNCGECCRYAKKIATFTYESCAFLSEKNMCSKHDSRYLVCKWFPFWVYHDRKYGKLLTIKPYCAGYGHGELVDYDKTMFKMLDLSVKIENQDDGAFVIHELIHLPGSKEWAFPSKENVDKLLKLISKNEVKSVTDNLNSSEFKGELNYAHHYTSGLLGNIIDPHLTVNEVGDITDVNDAFCKLSGKERTSLIGSNLSYLFVNNEGAEKDIHTCLYRGKITAIPHRIKLNDETTVPVLFNAMTFRDRVDGLVHGSLICIKEISDIIYNELAQSKNYVRGLIEASLDAFMVINLDGTLMDVNQAFIKITGCSREELIGSYFNHHFINIEEAQKGVSITFRDGEVKNYELDLKTSNNETIPVSFNATVFYNHENVVQGIFAVARDIRDNRRIVKQLEDSINYSRGLIESSVDLMVTVNHYGVITDVNEAAVMLTGSDRSELVGSEFKKYFDNPDYAQESVNTVFEKGKLLMRELNLVNKNGTHIPVSFNANVYYNGEGVIQGVFAIARDMSERILMITKLKEAENYARGLIESSIDLMVTVNCEGVVTDVNEAAVELTGCSREKLINSLFQDYFTDTKLAYQGINSAFREGKVKDYELELISSKAEKIPVSFNANVYKNCEGTVMGVFAIARDMR